MTELAQLFRADGRDGPPPWAPVADGDERFLYPAGVARVPDAQIHGASTFAGLVDWLTGRLAALGIETILLDQTHPDIGLPVVKMTAPGLRHFWPRFGAGRLYDTPLALGWRDAPFDEAALNPSHLFL
jgi:ribosomal protein S12 methylthiotransferase accessory factor